LAEVLIVDLSPRRNLSIFLRLSSSVTWPSTDDGCIGLGEGSGGGVTAGVGGALPPPKHPFSLNKILNIFKTRNILFPP
jgi:hypothetical protein